MYSIGNLVWVIQRFKENQIDKINVLKSMLIQKKVETNLVKNFQESFDKTIKSFNDLVNFLKSIGIFIDADLQQKMENFSGELNGRSKR